MNADEPFTSVKWDRDDSDAHDHISTENAEARTQDNQVGHNSPILEEEDPRSVSPGFTVSAPLDSSSLHSETVKKSRENTAEPTAGSSDESRGEEYPPGADHVAAAGSWQTQNEKEQKDGDFGETHEGSKTGERGDSAGHAEQPSAQNMPSSAVPVHDEMSKSKHQYEAPHIEENSASETDQYSQQHSYSPAQHSVPQEISDQKQMEAAFAKYSISSRVSNPISDRDGNSKPYISYLVTSDTNHPEVLKLTGNGASSENVTVKVRRRYGDFRFLHDCLISDFPQLLVPPLPAKSNFKYLTGDTFSTAFVHKRLNSLDRFVSFICQHKLLSQSSVFHYFISDSSEWASFTKNLKILKGEDDGSLVGKVVNEDLLTETIMNFFTPSKHKKETNKDILEISDKLKKLYENLVKLDRIFSKLNKKNVDLKSDYESFSNQINKLASLHENNGQSETGSQDPNSSFASSTDAHSGATSNFKIFSESLLFFSENWADLGRYIDESFLVSLKDCAKYIARLSSLIELHHNKKIDLQVLEDYLAKAKGDLSNMGGSVGDPHRAPPNPALIGQTSGGIVNSTTQLIKDTLSTSATPHIGSSQTENKKARLQQKIHNLEAEISAQTHLVNSLTSRIINEEYPNWDRFNKVQMKKSMSDLCDQEISFYKGLVDNWTDVEAKLVKRLDELK